MNIVLNINRANVSVSYIYV